MIIHFSFIVFGGSVFDVKTLEKKNGNFFQCRLCDTCEIFRKLMKLRQRYERKYDFNMQWMELSILLCRWKSCLRKQCQQHSHMVFMTFTFQIFMFVSSFFFLLFFFFLSFFHSSVIRYIANIPKDNMRFGKSIIGLSTWNKHIHWASTVREKWYW